MMVQFVCLCLNIRVHGKGSDSKLIEASGLGLSVNVLSDNFFSSEVYDVLLDLGGVTKAQKLLCHSRIIDDWVVTTCSGCETDIYAKHVDDNDRVLVSTAVEKETNRISSLMESESYSPLFKLVLPEINNSFIQNNIGIELSNSNLDHPIEHVQQQVSSYLREEQKAMEEQIRQFTEQQQQKFAALQQKVRKHKQAMVYLILKAQKSRKQNASEPMADSPLASPISPVCQNSGEDTSSSTDSAIVQSESTEIPVETKFPIQSTRVLRRSVSNPSHSKVKPKSKYIPRSIDVGGVFDMEGFDLPHEHESAPFDTSEDDTDASDNSASEDNVPEKEDQLYATSLPVTVPAFSNYNRYHNVEEDEKLPFFNDPDQIAESMQAYARSVHDGTEMFGDLPRRRLNTGDLIRSRLI